MQLTSLACSLLLTPSHRLVRPTSRCPAPMAHQYSADWMNTLGTATNSKKKWALPHPDNTISPGSVVLAEPGSFDHYFLESLVLIIDHGPTGTRGVLLNHETPWKVEEMSPGAILPFAANTIFLGGDAGRDTLTMIHGEAALPGAKELGRGVYSGGTASAVAAVSEGALPSDRFKFFYKTVEWLPNALELAITKGEFRLIELSPAWLFGQQGQRQQMWQEVRDELRKEEQAAQLARDSLLAASGSEGGGGDGGDGGGGESDGAGGLAAAASKGAAKLRGEVAAVQSAQEALKAMEKELKADAAEAHDAKVKAYVDQLQRDKASGRSHE